MGQKTTSRHSGTHFRARTFMVKPLPLGSN
jgi:hypothetical protein